VKRWHISHRIKLLDVGGNPCDVRVELESRLGVGANTDPTKLMGDVCYAAIA